MGISRERRFRRDAHYWFDILWMYKHFHSGKGINYWRNRQYKWLSRKLGIKREECHMSKMSIEECKRVIDICSNEYYYNKKLISFAEDYENGKLFQWYKIK